MYYFDKWIEGLYFRQKGNLALYDKLTGIYNYNWLEIIGKEKYNTKEVFVTVIDLNNFKMINDIKGHLYGNKLLENVAYQFKVLCDKNEGEVDCIRYGGDEFVIISTNNISESIKSCDDELISCGTYFKKYYELLDQAIEKADEIMYKNKKEKKKKKK